MSDLAKKMDDKIYPPPPIIFTIGSVIRNLATDKLREVERIEGAG